MKYGKIRAAAMLLLFIYTFFCIFPTAVYAHDGKAEQSASTTENNAAEFKSIKISSRFYELLKRKDKEDSKYLAVGGNVFGIKIKEKGVSVTESSGLCPLFVNDRIISVDGKKVNSAADIENAVKNSAGRALSFEIVRDGETLNLNITPKMDGTEYRLGVSLRSIASGIGTVTFIDPETGMFGGLGHGVCNSKGELLTLDSGVSTDVILGGIKRGEAGKPGELSGALGKRSTGVINKNSECGIFGVFEHYVMDDDTQFLPVGKREDVKAGEAMIMSTVKNGRCGKYKIEIYDIDYTSEGSKSFKVKLADENLSSMTGGIVRGMSGSPIIQNGKIVGAVTHVMVNDPSVGYGIFIENMLSEMTAK